MKSLSESSLRAKRKAYQEFLKRKATGVRTGIPSLDNYLLGLGNFVNIQGETSSCKSVLGLQIAHYNLLRGTPCLMIDKENGDGRVTSRLLCQANQISDYELRHSGPDSIDKAYEGIEKLSMHLHTEPINTLQELEKAIEDVWNTYQVPFILLYDSIQAADFI